MASKVDVSTVATGAAIMAAIGAVDALLDENVAPAAARTGWKTLLGCAGICLNIASFSKGGKFENETHLTFYLTSLAAATSLALYAIRK